MSNNKKIITIIVAVSENNVIGKDNKLIWHLPDDLKRFKRLTSGHSIIMGRKTFESFPGLLPNRKHIVMSKKLNKNFHKDVAVVDSFKDAINATEDDKNPFIIGGGEIYKLALELNVVDRIYLTRVHHKSDGDTFFPYLENEKWKEIDRSIYKKDEKHKYDFTFLTYEKII